MKGLTAKHVLDICHFRDNGQCCSFMEMTANGIRCLKGTDKEPGIRVLHENGILAAKGDNCQGASGVVPLGKLLKEAAQR
jgi:hypothetical protein